MRNKPCPCGSGRKFKKCCLGKEQREAHAWEERSKEDMEFMAKALGITVPELQERFQESKAKALEKRFKRSTAMAATFMALYGGIQI